MMKVSKPTLDTFKNFASINTNLLVREGQTLSTVSNSMNILCRAAVSESFPREFAIYDLNQFLSLLTMDEDADLEFGDESVTVKTGVGKFEFFYAEPSVIKAAPDKEIPVEELYSFSVTRDTIQTIYRAASAISAPFLRVVGDGSQVSLSVGDPNTPKSNSFTMSLGTSDLEFDARLGIDSLKIIPDDYDVTIGTKPVMKFSNSDRVYWLALDPSSKVG